MDEHGTNGNGNLYARLVLAAAIAFFGIRFFLFTSRYSVNVFFWDQWDFLTPLFRGNPRLLDLFLWQHGPHREGVGLIADKLLYPLTHWNGRTDSFLVAACIFGAMLLALVLKRRILGPLTFSDIAIPAIFLTMAQYEVIVGAPNPSYAGFPVLMIMLYCIGLQQPKLGLRYTTVLLLNFLLIYTGFGFFMGAVTIGVFGLECYWSRRNWTETSLALAFLGLVIAGASLGMFFVHYTWTPAVGCYQPPHLSWDYPWFVAILWSRFLVRSNNVFFITMFGAILLAAAVGIVVSCIVKLLRRGPAPIPLITAVLISFSLLFSINAAIGRVCLGIPEAAQPSRYVTLMIPGFLGIYFFLREKSSKGAQADEKNNIAKPKWNIRRTVLTVFVLAVLASSGLKRLGNSHLPSEGKRAWAECYRRTADIYGCEEKAHFKIHPNPENTGLQWKLDFLQQHRLNLFAGGPP